MSLKDAASALNAKGVITRFDTVAYQKSLANELEHLGFSRELNPTRDCYAFCKTDDYPGVDLICPDREGPGSSFLRVALWESGPVLHSGRAEFFCPSGIVEDAFKPENIMRSRALSVSLRWLQIGAAEEIIVLWIQNHAGSDICRNLQSAPKLPPANLGRDAAGPA